MEQDAFYFKEFLKYVNRISPVNKKESNFLRENFPIRIHHKDDIILSEGEISNTIYFVLKGCVRLFYNADGNEKTAFFYTEGKFICAGESYTKGVPAIENYQALEDTVLMHFDKRPTDRLLQLYPHLEIIARLGTEDELITCQKIIASFVTLSPEKRYLELLETNPSLFQRANQQHIASYLGVSPETLSRIKKRVFRKNS
jgi:CRP-like cAMP-binding protein